MTVNLNRSLLKLILLSIITLGIYEFVFYYKWARDVNIICDGDGNKTPGLLAFMFLSLITFGIYGLWWYYSLGNRLNNNAERYNCTINENGTTILVWMLVGMFVCGICSLIALHYLIRNTNTLAIAYTERSCAI